MLTLPIKKKWFDLILSGEKKEEYRGVTKYYESRFQNIFGDSSIEKHEIMFRNGYSKTSPSFVAVCSWHVGKGKHEWGASDREVYNILTIYEIKERKKC